MGSVADAKQRAAQDGSTLGRVMEQALRAYLGQPARGAGGFRLKWRTERGRLLPGVRLDDRDALFDLMDGKR